jgi:hypothetical protein
MGADRSCPRSVAKLDGDRASRRSVHDHERCTGVPLDRLRAGSYAIRIMPAPADGNRETTRGNIRKLSIPQIEMILQVIDKRVE